MNNSNNSKQPEALHLADYLEFSHRHAEHSPEFIAAGELRRLYAEVDSLSYCLAYPDNFVKEPEQEPVARSKAYDMIDRFLQNNLNSDEDYAEYSKALDSIYASPPQRQPLTRPQINQMMADAGWQNSAIRQADLDKVEKVARAIEAAHGIKEDV